MTALPPYKTSHPAMPYFALFTQQGADPYRAHWSKSHYGAQAGRRTLHTSVAARRRRPESSVRFGHARPIPDGVTITALPQCARHFLVIALHRETRTREESLGSSREITQIKATVLVFDVSIPPYPNWKGEELNVLHGRVEFVHRVTDCLVTPMVLCWVISAQIVNLYNYGVPKRALVARIERVLGRGYLEATSASVTITVVSAECKLVDRGREPGSEIHAACCRIISRLAWAPWSTITNTRK